MSWATSFYDGWDWGAGMASSHGAPYRRLAGGGTGLAGAPYYCKCDRYDFDEAKMVEVHSGGPAPDPEAWSGTDWTVRTMGSGYEPYNKKMWQITYKKKTEIKAACKAGEFSYTPPGSTTPMKCDDLFTELDLSPANCMADGVRNGRTVSFTTAVYCEMLRAYTVKSDLPAFATFFRNNWMHLACTISAVMTIAVSFIPILNTDIFRLNRISPQLYAIALAFAFMCMVFDEIYKIRFRMILADRIKTEQQTTAQKNMSSRIEIVVDMLEKHAKMQTENQTDMREIKMHVGELEKSLRAGGPSTPSMASPTKPSNSAAHSL
jgi:hypothetical protein